MSFYDFNINDASVEMLPPDKRYLNNVNLIRSLLSTLQWFHDLFFHSYYEGIVPATYAPGIYNYLDQVVYDKKVYLSLINNNSDLPTTSNWTLVQNDFIGLQERVLYNGSKLVLEYALNKEFNTTFRQPPVNSDIYISNDNPSVVGFLVGLTEPYCSSVGRTTSSDAIGPGGPFLYTNNFVIHIPSAALALTNTQAITNFVNKYIPASLKFTIQAY